MKQIPIYRNGSVIGYVKLREIAELFSVDTDREPDGKGNEPIVIRLRSRWPAGSHFVAYTQDIAREFMPKRWKPGA